MTTTTQVVGNCCCQEECLSCVDCSFCGACCGSTTTFGSPIVPTGGFAQYREYRFTVGGIVNCNGPNDLGSPCCPPLPDPPPNPFNPCLFDPVCTELRQYPLRVNGTHVIRNVQAGCSWVGSDFGDGPPCVIPWIGTPKFTGGFVSLAGDPPTGNPCGPAGCLYNSDGTLRGHFGHFRLVMADITRVGQYSPGQPAQVRYTACQVNCSDTRFVCHLDVFQPRHPMTCDLAGNRCAMNPDSFPRSIVVEAVGDPVPCVRQQGVGIQSFTETSPPLMTPAAKAPPTHRQKVEARQRERMLRRKGGCGCGGRRRS